MQQTLAPLHRPSPSPASPPSSRHGPPPASFAVAHFPAGSRPHGTLPMPASSRSARSCIFLQSL
jgi:hypothetical protein